MAASASCKPIRGQLSARRPFCSTNRRQCVLSAQQHDGPSAQRRDILLMSTCVSLGMLLPPTVAAEEDAVAAVQPVAAEPIAAAPAPAPAPAPSAKGQMQELYDEILAYKFQYPVSTASGQPLKMIVAHAPEKYSSAAPLTADARQRIVSELLDLRNFVSASVSVGPASGVLKGVDPAQWKPYDVALTVLVDRSTSRLTSGQRTALNDIERVSAEERDGARYIVYEHVSQGSPTLLEASKKETYRHALSVTTVRPDSQGNPYLYTLNMSCRQEQWADLEPLFKEAVASFRLVPPTRNYISPDTNPWQFW